ncbi:Hypothetical predicted protein [Mytilus galloprovincialis]|uniref:Reverse transcriptase domain-containing protein n=1 Tax=Mytilus galloprovincialis TaxID=29158 RepID=A0A8B6E157_MYTGA|nr:Hypothetical predicted protein [Mytilus galloprovincialis]
MVCRRFKSSCRYRNKRKREKLKTRKLNNKYKSRKIREESCKKFVLNLSSRLLTNEEYLLLGKGMKFIPTPKVSSTYIRKQIMKDFLELARKLRCRFHYSTNTIKEIHPLYLQTGHIPPNGNNALEGYITDTKLEISRLKVKQFKHNLTLAERTAFNYLIKDDSIYISKADKNNTTVVVNTLDYINAGTNHLNSDHYKKINHTNTELIARSISKIVNKLFTNKEIDEHTYNFLSDCKNPKHGYMYLLPKIHKIRQDSLEAIKLDGYKIGELAVPFRPIINKCNSPTRRIEKFLDLILKPLLRKLEFYIQDTKDFINRIESKTCVRNCTLIAYDVTSMYTNMNIDNLLDTTKNFLDQIDRTKYKFKVPNKSDLISFAKIILENNEFQFNGTLYKQVIGAPQGGIKRAPSKNKTFK